ncbi:MAG: Uncharacterised protein [Bacteroidota bacterium]|nr:MAG: Uncharacterised protein [Bacteroidota bacterium]
MFLNSFNGVIKVLSSKNLIFQTLFHYYIYDFQQNT